MPRALDPDRCLHILSCLVNGFRGVGMAIRANKNFERTLEEELWARIWEWLCWLDTNKDQLPFLRTDREAYHRVVGSIFHNGTPGLFTVIGRTWSYFVEHDVYLGYYSTWVDVSDAETALTDLSALYRLAPGRQGGFEEVLDGVGGTYADLAELITKNLQRTIHRASLNDYTISLPEHILVQIQGLATFTLQAMQRDNALVPDLAHAKTPRNLTAVARALAGMRLDGPGPRAVNVANSARTTATMALVLRTLAHLCREDPKNGLAVSLNSQLLHGLLMAGSNPVLTDRIHLLQPFLRELIPQSLVFHSVIAALENYFKRDPNLTAQSGNQMLDQTLRDDWRSMLRLAHERIGVLRKYVQDGTLTKWRACDNPKCWKICGKTEIKRCGGCFSRYYCSRACQKADYRPWHRTACPRFRKEHLFVSKAFTDVDRRFFRALLTHDFEAHQLDISVAIVSFLRVQVGQNTLEVVPHLVFDYAAPGYSVSIRVGTRAEIEHGPNDVLSRSTDFEEDLPTGRSAGKMLFVAMRIAHPLISQSMRWYRRRFASGEYLCSLGDIAHEIQVEDSDPTRERVQGVIDKQIGYAF
uniref:MYND-type domain-containing protein n=1 Tax=Mycena chlorophos TaxID=658473 RepID=A0ABQ0LEA9_MYCCL|nr:predicted protein [Mycena chlorophos]